MGNFSCKSFDEHQQSVKASPAPKKLKAPKSKGAHKSKNKPKSKNEPKSKKSRPDDSLGQRRRHRKKHSEQKHLCDIIKKEKTMFDGKIVNPKTVRLINQDGRTMKQIQQGCDKFQKSNVRKFLEKEKTIQKEQKVVNPKSVRKINVKKKTYKDLTKK